MKNRYTSYFLLSVLVMHASAPATMLCNDDRNARTSFLSKAYETAKASGQRAYSKVKSSGRYISDTVASDLTSIFSWQGQSHEGPVELMSEKSQFLKAVRIYVYNQLIRGLIFKGFKVPAGARQFEPHEIPGFVEAVMIAPIVEEFLFSFLPVGYFGNWAQLFSPILFGLGHVRSKMNKELASALFLWTAISRFINNGLLLHDTRHPKWQESFKICWMEHMLNNFIEVSRLKLQAAKA